MKKLNRFPPTEYMLYDLWMALNEEWKSYEYNPLTGGYEPKVFEIITRKPKTKNASKRRSRTSA